MGNSLAWSPDWHAHCFGGREWGSSCVAGSVGIEITFILSPDDPVQAAE
jgi:hypothetical protein